MKRNLFFPMLSTAIATLFGQTTDALRATPLLTLPRHASGRFIKNSRKRPGRYIPGGKRRNCGWHGISPKSYTGPVHRNKGRVS